MIKYVFTFIISINLFAQVEQFSASEDKTNLSKEMIKSNEVSKKILSKLSGDTIEESFMNLPNKEIFGEDNIKYDDKLSCLIEISKSSSCQSSSIYIPSLKAIALFGVYENNIGYYIINKNINYFISLDDLKSDYVEGRIDLEGTQIVILKNNFRYSLAYNLEGEKKIKETSKFYENTFKSSKISRHDRIDITKANLLNKYVDNAIECNISNVLNHLTLFREDMRKENLSPFDTIGYKHYQSFLRCSKILSNTKNITFGEKLKSIGQEFKQYVIHPNSF